MRVLAIQSTGDQTSVSVINNDDILTYSLDHERKDRPDWNKMLQNIGLGMSFTLNDIDLFAYANSTGSYTATRSVASYLKGISVALNQPLMAISANNIDELSADSIAKLALDQFKQSDYDKLCFDPDEANPIYASDPQYKKINE
jgi:hypothetical protein